MNVFQVIFEGPRIRTQKRVAAEALAAASVSCKKGRSVLLEAARVLATTADETAILEQLLGGENIVLRVVQLLAASTAPVFVVKGHQLGDGNDSVWVCDALGDMTKATAIAKKLNSLVGRYGESIGKPDLVGLDDTERNELALHAQTLDGNVRVGRHGVRWSVDSVCVRR